MKKNEKVLVIGGSGFVGHALCDLLRKNDIATINFSNDTEQIAGCENISGDVADKDQLESVFKKYSIRCVVNLASLLHSASIKNPLLACKIGVGGSLNLLELCKDHGVNRFIYGSSTALLRPCADACQGVDENAPVHTASIYEEIKRFVEEMGQRTAKAHSLEFISARISLVIGPGRPSQTSAYRTEIFNKLLTGGEIHIPFAKHEVLPFNHYADVAEALLLLVNAPALMHSVYNLPCESWRVTDLADLLCKMNQNIAVTFGDLQFASGAPYVNWGRMQVELGASIVPLDQRLLEYKTFLLQRRKDVN